jgi:glycosyltransferase 2 family protein
MIRAPQLAARKESTTRLRRRNKALRNPRVWIGFAVSIVFLYLAFRGQDFQAIQDALRRANYWYVVPALALYFIGVYLRAFRWGIVLRAIAHVPTTRLFPVVVIGYMANNILPLRAGEFVRSYVLSTRTGIRKTSILATIAVERIFDGVTMLLFILIASMFIALTDQLENVTLVAALLFGSVLALLALLTTQFARDLLVSRLIPLLPAAARQRAERMLTSVFTGLSVLRRRNDMIIVSIVSIIAWLFEASMYMVIAIGFGLELSIAAVLLVTAVANLATLIPSSPGYIGPFEAGVLLALVGALGIQRELALSFAIVVHAALYVPITLWGLGYWWRESLSWREMRRLATEEART